MTPPTVEESAAAGCCLPPVDPRIARRFDERASEWTDADDFPELVDVSARMLDLLRDSPLRRPSVLEIGSGTGGLSVALLEMGASRVTGIDLSPASVAVARRRAEAEGYAEQASFEVGNAVQSIVAPHDWVLLDRVICCFDDVERLVGRALELAHERICISVPESRGWRGMLNRPSWAIKYAWDSRSGSCRGYVHDLRRIEDRLAAAGFMPAASARAGLWYIGSYERPAQPKVAVSPASRSRGA